MLGEEGVGGGERETKRAQREPEIASGSVNVFHIRKHSHFPALGEHLQCYVKRNHTINGDG